MTTVKLCSDDFNLGTNYFKKSQIGIKDIHARAFLHGIRLVVTNYNIVEIDKWPIINKREKKNIKFEIQILLCYRVRDMIFNATFQG